MAYKRPVLIQSSLICTPRLALALSLTVILALFLPAVCQICFPVANAAESETDPDAELIFRARQKLLQEPTLQPFNLGVNVRHGIAVLWGTVGSTYHKQRAENLLRGFPGLRSIQNDLRVASGNGPDLAPDTLAIERPWRQDQQHVKELPAIRVNSPSPGRGVTPPWRPAGSPAFAGVPSENKSPTSLTGSIVPPPPAKLGLGNGCAWTHPYAPQAMARPGSETKQEQFSLKKRIAGLQKENPRYSRVQIVIRDSFVYLSGAADHSEDTFLFAQALAELQGVERVIVTSPARH